MFLRFESLNTNDRCVDSCSVSGDDRLQIESHSSQRLYGLKAQLHIDSLNTTQMIQLHLRVFVSGFVVAIEKQNKNIFTNSKSSFGTASILAMPVSNFLFRNASTSGTCTSVGSFFFRIEKQNQLCQNKKKQQQTFTETAT